MKKTFSCLRLLTLLIAVIWAVPSFAQISIGGTPPSFMYETRHKALQSAISLPIDFDVVAMRAEDALRDAAGVPPRVGTIIPVNNLTTENSGEWSTLPDGQHIWRLSITAKDAIAIMLTYDKFEIPAGGQLFIYNDDRSRVLGAYTEANNPKRVEYATEFVPGDRIILEYVAPAGDNFSSPIVLTGVVYGYNNLYVHSKEGDPSRNYDSGGSKHCMLNVTCSEGNNWTDEKQGVVRIITRAGGYIYMCSGSMINNTARDLDPLFLSAWHCYNGRTPAEINQSVYYFKYEHPTCEGRSNPTVPTITGATVLAENQIVGGSDGILLRLNEGNQQFFMNNGIYFNGWDRRNTAATSGVGIHHPSGDVKKISTFTTTVASAQVNVTNHGLSASNAMWRVSWAATANGRSVTQGGSSGSPLFNQNKRIVGTLCAGSSDCDNTTGQDFYGKLWYHWDQPYSENQWLKTFLDPIDSNEEYIDGTYIAGNKTLIVVRAENKQMQENDAVPALTITFSGQPQGTHTFADIVSATVTTSAGSASPAGTYAIVVTSENLIPDDYFITNVNGVLTITAYPTIITQQPTSTETFLCEGSTHTFTVAGTGLELKYQWQKFTNGFWLNIAGANEPSYTIDNITMSSAGDYRARLISRTSEAISNVVKLKVGINPSNILVFEWHDVPIINCNSTTNGGYNFSTFQWKKNGVNIPGATKPYIQIEPGAIYDCEITTTDRAVFNFCNPISHTSRTTEQLVVYPNPAPQGESIIVQLLNAQPGTMVNVFDLNGGLIKGNIPMHGSEATVNVSGIRAGIYVIQVVSPDGVKHAANIVLN